MIGCLIEHLSTCVSIHVGSLTSILLVQDVPVACRKEAALMCRHPEDVNTALTSSFDLAL